LILGLLVLISLMFIAPPAALAYPPKPVPKEEPQPAAEAKPENQGEQGEKKTEEDEEEKEEDRYFAVTGAIVHTVGGPTLAGPTILTKNGKIAAIGHDVEIPDDAEILDAAGFHLYPGLVAVSSSGLVGSSAPEDSTDVFNLSMNLALAGGITTVVSGNTAAKLTFGTLEDHVVKGNLFHTLSYTTRSPDARRQFRDTLERVRQYIRDLNAYEEKKKTDPQAKEPDKAWLKGNYETAFKLMRNELVAVADADTAQHLRELAELAQQYNLRVVIRGAYEGWTVAPEMARAGLRAVVTPRTNRDPDEELNRPNGSSIENARILHDHGVTLAIIPSSTGIATWGIAGRDLMHLTMEAAFAVRGGLPNETAIRAITIDAARILGIDHRVGSVEVGKDADFAIVDGELLHYMTMVRWTVVNGRIAYDKDKDSLLSHIRPGGDRDAPAPADYWPRSLGEPLETEVADEPEAPPKTGDEQKETEQAIQ
jgi:imidazolonepropionase-like amidohydrolase